MRLRPEGQRRGIAFAVAVFLAVLVAGVGAISVARRPLATAFCSLTNRILLHHVVIGNGGRVHLRALATPAAFRSGDNASADAAAALTVENFAGAFTVSFNVRREVYVPVVMLVAAIAAAPLRTRRKGVCLLFGIPITLLGSIAALWLLCLWLFANQLSGVLPLGSVSLAALDLVYRAILLPPGSRFVFAAMVAAALIHWQRHQPAAPPT